VHVSDLGRKKLIELFLNDKLLLDSFIKSFEWFLYNIGYVMALGVGVLNCSLRFGRVGEGEAARTVRNARACFVF